MRFSCGRCSRGGALVSGGFSRAILAKSPQMFVDPGWSGNGIGGQLMRYIEGLAAEEGYDYMETEASITAHGFYLSLGYTDLGQNDGDLGLTYSMRKPLR